MTTTPDTAAASVDPIHYDSPAAHATCLAAADRVRPYLEAYRNDQLPDSDIKYAIVDLLTDLIHYTATIDVNWNDIADRAHSHVTGERDGIL